MLKIQLLVSSRSWSARVSILNLWMAGAAVRSEIWRFCWGHRKWTCVHICWNKLWTPLFHILDCTMFTLYFTNWFAFCSALQTSCGVSGTYVIHCYSAM